MKDVDKTEKLNVTSSSSFNNLNILGVKKKESNKNQKTTTNISELNDKINLKLNLYNNDSNTQLFTINDKNSKTEKLNSFEDSKKKSNQKINYKYIPSSNNEPLNNEYNNIIDYNDVKLNKLVNYSTYKEDKNTSSYISNNKTSLKDHNVSTNALSSSQFNNNNYCYDFNSRYPKNINIYKHFDKYHSDCEDPITIIPRNCFHESNEIEKEKNFVKLKSTNKKVCFLNSNYNNIVKLNSTNFDQSDNSNKKNNLYNYLKLRDYDINSNNESNNRNSKSSDAIKKTSKQQLFINIIKEKYNNVNNNISVLKKSHLDSLFINLYNKSSKKVADYIEKNQKYIKLFGSRYYTNQNPKQYLEKVKNEPDRGEFISQNIHKYNNNEDSPKSLKSKSSKKSIKKYREFIKEKDNKIIGSVTYNIIKDEYEPVELTPMPSKSRKMMKNDLEKNEFFEVERSAVTMRRWEYTHNLNNKRTFVTKEIHKFAPIKIERRSNSKLNKTMYTNNLDRNYSRNIIHVNSNFNKPIKYNYSNLNKSINNMNIISNNISNLNYKNLNFVPKTSDIEINNADSNNNFQINNNSLNISAIEAKNESKHYINIRPNNSKQSFVKFNNNNARNKHINFIDKEYNFNKSVEENELLIDNNNSHNNFKNQVTENNINYEGINNNKNLSQYNYNNEISDNIKFNVINSTNNIDENNLNEDDDNSFYIDFNSRGAIERIMYIQRAWRRYFLIKMFSSEFIQKHVKGFLIRKKIKKTLIALRAIKYSLDKLEIIMFKKYAIIFFNRFINHKGKLYIMKCIYLIQKHFKKRVFLNKAKELDTFTKPKINSFSIAKVYRKNNNIYNKYQNILLRHFKCFLLNQQSNVTKNKYNNIMFNAKFKHINIDSNNIFTKYSRMFSSNILDKYIKMISKSLRSSIKKTEFNNTSHYFSILESNKKNTKKFYTIDSINNNLTITNNHSNIYDINTCYNKRLTEYLNNQLSISHIYNLNYNILDSNKEIILNKPIIIPLIVRKVTKSLGSIKTYNYSSNTIKKHIIKYINSNKIKNNFIFVSKEALFEIKINNSKFNNCKNHTTSFNINSNTVKKLKFVSNSINTNSKYTKLSRDNNLEYNINIIKYKLKKYLDNQTYKNLLIENTYSLRHNAFSPIEYNSENVITENFIITKENIINVCQETNFNFIKNEELTQNQYTLSFNTYNYEIIMPSIEQNLIINKKECFNNDRKYSENFFKITVLSQNLFKLKINKYATKIQRWYKYTNNKINLDKSKTLIAEDNANLIDFQHVKETIKGIRSKYSLYNSIDYTKNFEFVKGNKCTSLITKSQSYQLSIIYKIIKLQKTFLLFKQLKLSNQKSTKIFEYKIEYLIDLEIKFKNKVYNKAIVNNCNSIFKKHTVFNYYSIINKLIYTIINKKHKRYTNNKLYLYLANKMCCIIKSSQLKLLIYVFNEFSKSYFHLKYNNLFNSYLQLLRNKFVSKIACILQETKNNNVKTIRNFKIREKRLLDTYQIISKTYNCSYLMFKLNQILKYASNYINTHKYNVLCNYDSINYIPVLKPYIINKENLKNASIFKYNKLHTKSLISKELKYNNNNIKIRDYFAKVSYVVKKTSNINFAIANIIQKTIRNYLTLNRKRRYIIKTIECNSKFFQTSNKILFDNKNIKECVQESFFVGNYKKYVIRLNKSLISLNCIYSKSNVLFFDKNNEEKQIESYNKALIQNRVDINPSVFTKNYLSKISYKKRANLISDFFKSILYNKIQELITIKKASNKLKLINSNLKSHNSNFDIVALNNSKPKIISQKITNKIFKVLYYKINIYSYYKKILLIQKNFRQFLLTKKYKFNKTNTFMNIILSFFKSKQNKLKNSFIKKLVYYNNLKKLHTIFSRVKLNIIKKEVVKSAKYTNLYFKDLNILKKNRIKLLSSIIELLKEHNKIIKNNKIIIKENETLKNIKSHNKIINKNSLEDKSVEDQLSKNPNVKLKINKIIDDDIDFSELDFFSRYKKIDEKSAKRAKKIEKVYKKMQDENIISYNIQPNNASMSNIKNINYNNFSYVKPSKTSVKNFNENVLIQNINPGVACSINLLNKSTYSESKQEKIKSKENNNLSDNKNCLKTRSCFNSVCFSNKKENINKLSNKYNFDNNSNNYIDNNSRSYSYIFSPIKNETRLTYYPDMNNTYTYLYDNENHKVVKDEYYTAKIPKKTICYRAFIRIKKLPKRIELYRDYKETDVFKSVN